MTEILVTDIDNTLYDYVDFFGPSFRAMLYVLSSDLKAPEDSLYEEFRDLFQEIGTFDFQFLIARLSFCRTLSPDELKNQIGRGRQAWDRTKAKRLKPYPGVIETLRRLNAGGVKIVAVTNAPYYHAYRRLRDIGAIDYLSGFVCWCGNYPAEEERQTKFEQVRRSLETDFEMYALLEKDRIKPSSDPFRKVVDHFGPDNNFYAVGDSLHKDLLPARQFNMITIWARYGTLVDKRNLDTLLRITPWSATEVKEHLDQNFKADFEADSFETLSEIIPHEKRYLFQGDLFDE
jgi:phosphoglycolate phosphatase